MIYDVTRTISPSLAVWPGDTPFSFEVKEAIAQGAAVNLTTLTMSAHTGTHIDATWHFNDDGIHPAQMPIERYVGPARVVTLDVDTGPINAGHFEGHALTGVERLLLHTTQSDLDDEQWRNNFPYPTPELAEWLGEQGIKLLGVDMPSVDPMGSKTMSAHHALNRADIVILENLMLRDVPDGDYELIALPLKIADVCGSPVRAILRAIATPE